MTVARRSRLVVAATALALLLAGCQNQGPQRGGGGKHMASGTSSSATTPGTTSTGQAEQGTTPLGAKWDWGRYDQFQPYLTSLKGGYTYYEVVWCQVEPTQGHPDWSGLDRIATRSRDLGIHLLLKLRVGRCWATGGEAQHARGSKNKTESAMPRDLATYSAWVRAAVTRYSALGVHEYAVENEINSEGFWAGTPAQFEQLATTAATAIRGADPQAKVVDAGLSSTTYGYGIADDLLRKGRDAEAVAAYDTYYRERIGTRGDKIPSVTDRAGLEAVLRSAQGERNLAYLALMTKLAEEKVTDVRQIHFYEASDAVPLLFTYLHAHTPASTPIEAWEVGSFDKSTTDDKARTAEMLRTVSLVLAGGARLAIWLPLAFDPAGRNPDEPRFGLLDPDGTVRDAGRAFQSLVTASHEATVTPVSGHGLSGVGFQRGATTTAFVWAQHPTTVRLASGEEASAPDGSGARSSSSVAVGPEPVRLVLNRTTQVFLGGQS